MESKSCKTPNLPDGYVRLDVGGTFYTTSLSTLTRYPNSMLYNMFTQEKIPLAQDKKGRYIIDRDGAVFRYILNFLRGGNLNLPPEFSDYEQLKEEVDFYQLNEMKKLLDLWKGVKLFRVYSDRMHEPTAKSSTVTLKAGDKDFHIRRDTISGTLEKKLQYMAKQPTTVDKKVRVEYQFPPVQLWTEPTRLMNGTVDCDPTSFQCILNFLMRSGSYMPKNQEEFENLKIAAHEYGIDDMKTLLDHQICDACSNYLMLQT